MPVASRLALDLDYLLSWTEQSTQAVIITDAQGLIRAINRSFTELLQVTKARLVGKPLTDYLMTPFPIHFASKIPTSFHGRLLCGGDIMVKTNVHAVTGQDEADTYHTLTFYPVSTCEHVKEKLFERIGVGVWLQDENHRVLKFNSVAGQYLGVEPSTVLFRSVDHLVQQLDAAQTGYQSLVAFLNEPYTSDDSLDLQWMGRSLRLLKISTEDELTEFQGTFYVLENRTELQSLSQQVWTNNRLATIGQIAAGTAHEIRNPLTSIRGFLQVIGHKLKESGQHQEQGYIDIMLKEIHRINHLVGEFLLLSKPRDIQLKQVSLGDVLKDIFPIIESEATYRNVQVIHRKSCERFPKIRADGELLKQVFLNLCKNGIESMEDGGRLTIHLTEDEVQKRGIIEIIDEGTGIPEWILAKIFDPFFTTKENGTGLGLPICKQILREIHGDITVESSPTGTTFRVSLPIQ